MQSIYIWCVILIVSLGIEAMTMNLITIWIALGSFAALLSSLLIDNFVIQSFVFVVVTLVTLIFTRKFVVDVLKVKSVKTNLDIVVGQVGLVINDITPDKPGRISVAGKSWAAISDIPISKGEHVDILAIEGVTLVAKRRDE